MDAMLLSDKKPGIIGAPGDLVSMSRVQKVYGGGLAGVHALHDIELHVASGEFVVVCGPGGSGKTTLLNLAGMLDTASEGTVAIASLLVSRLSEQARADLRGELIGFVFQSPGLVASLSARENVLLPLMLRGCVASADGARERVDALLDQLGMAAQAGHKPSRLDASQCQRIAIARALIARPRLVIADEPGARLDGACIRLVMDLFARQQQEQGTAFLVSTRDQRQLSRADRTLQLCEGRLDGVPGDSARRPLRVQP